ncbi:MAG: hypothetical protein ACWA5P_04760 [bacterium]
MKTLLKTFSLTCFFALLFLNTQCDEDGCNDCLEFDGKMIQVIDSNGANLLVGEFAIYDTNTIKIIAGGEYEVPIFINESDGLIEFGIEQEYDDYELILSDTESDFINFQTTNEPSINCCGSVRISTATFLNTIEIPNESLITIIKD